MELWTEAKAVTEPIKQEQKFQGCTVTVRVMDLRFSQQHWC